MSNQNTFEITPSTLSLATLGSSTRFNPSRSHVDMIKLQEYSQILKFHLPATKTFCSESSRYNHEEMSSNSIPIDILSQSIDFMPRDDAITKSCSVLTQTSNEFEQIIGIKLPPTPKDSAYKQPKMKIQFRPSLKLPLENIKPPEKFDLFSEDEEPVLRATYTPHFSSDVLNPFNEVIAEPNLQCYDVRKGVPKIEPPKHYSIPRDFINLNHKSRPSSLRLRTSLRNASGSCNKKESVNSFNIRTKNYDNVAPYQRDLHWISLEEITLDEIRILKGLWRSITHDLWNFGALTTINLFKMRGHLNNSDQIATSNAMLNCRFLWPHANQTMKAIEKVVLNLHQPNESHQFIYDLGRNHWKLKIPFTDNLSQILINAFIYTFAQHVHPQLTLTESHVLRKFSNIIMFLFVDASKWNSSPNSDYPRRRIQRP